MGLSPLATGDRLAHPGSVRYEGWMLFRVPIRGSLCHYVPKSDGSAPDHSP